MWYRWRKINRATSVPDALRANFEEYGEVVVAQICGRPYTHATGQTPGVPEWACHDDERRHALSWLREKHNEEERRRDITEAMEVAIIVLAHRIHDGAGFGVAEVA
jgi:hypothetical protein